MEYWPPFDAVFPLPLDHQQLGKLPDILSCLWVVFNWFVILRDSLFEARSSSTFPQNFLTCYSPTNLQQSQQLTFLDVVAVGLLVGLN